MENHYAGLFRIFMLNCLVLFLSFAGVRSAPVTLSITDVMKNDSNICPTSKFLYDSKYMESCASMAYPTTSLDYNPATLPTFLCLGIYDTAYKICQYSSQLQIPVNNTAFNSYMEKYVPNENQAPTSKTFSEDFCNSLQGFTSLYNKIDSLWGELVKSLNTPHQCMRICFDFQDKFRPVCAVFAWIKSINDNIKNAKKTEILHEFPVSDKPYMNQSKDEVTVDIKTIESKRIETKDDLNEQDRKQIANNINNNVKEGNVPGDVLPVKADEEKTKSDTEKVYIQKKINNISEIQVHKSEKENRIDTNLGTNAEVAKPKDNSDLQVPSMNNAVNNIKNAQKSNKEQNIDDFKPSTLSENTQDHYDAGNLDENVENDIDDVDDTLQHPDTGNQNENVQEIFEPKNNNARLTEYSNMRTEDDSHFFTYFTVITLVCLAGYIGYHNKQKIFAIVLEGRRSRSNRGRRRPSTASYRKLDCTLEEAVTSQCNANVTHVIY
ncbi:PREDICTED: trans-Golgi network integral membrane protein TGN38-like isoform X2 [Wasmannia auropunctata]|uniref:trans-Golgi network integral membrane protein TGN38-like isoform X2 n=1 Tax=Wasmannia auropunctata TaxID=64793 RepID=UPI0005EF1438|nr:PREDICTED: trans-Golgi network integral membrane protein TGN38-like isoform X2 [Wasmannia auropunctata]